MLTNPAGSGATTWTDTNWGNGVDVALAGLSNVNNTADSAKPVSTAQAAAIAAYVARGRALGVTTDPAACYTITHSLGVVPSAIILTTSGSLATDVFEFRVESRTTTTALIVVFRNGTVAGSYTFATGAGFDWIAFP